MRNDIIVTDEKLTIAGVSTISGGSVEVLETVAALATSGRPSLIVTPNVDHVLELSSNEKFRSAYRLADEAIVDGMPVVKLAQLLGAKGVQRNTGADLLTSVCEAARGRGWRVAILGGRADNCRKAVDKMTAATGADIHPVEVPFIETIENGDWTQVITRLSEVQANIVFVCLGSPKQELWFAQWRDQLPPAVYVGAGAAVDFAAGAAPRAPHFVQQTSLEWLWRLGHDPRRLWKRYLVRGPKFLIVIGEALATKFSNNPNGQRGESTILQIGPSPAGAGGMAAVIREMLSIDFGQFTQKSQPTWGDRTGLWSLVSGAQVGLRMIAERRQWAIAHLHLSESGSFIREGALVLLSRLLGRPAVVTLHGAEFDGQVRRHPILTRFVLRHASIAICLGRDTEAAVQSLVPGLPTKVVMNPLASRYIASSKTTPRTEPSSATFVFAGERGIRKGTDRLLAAWPTVRRRIPEARLIIAGPDPRDESELVERPELAGVEYHAALSRENIAEILSEATAAVLPSRAEVLPMFILEAIALGTPAIYTKVGEWQEFQSCEAVDILTETEESRLIQELSTRMISVATDPCWPALSQAAQQWAEKYVSPQVISSELTIVYRELVTKGPVKANMRGRK